MSSSEQIELFCVAHKPPPIALPAGTKIIGVSGFERGHFSDATGAKQISEKNPRFCELTAIYWLLNNHSFQGSHVGICHYRRLWSDAFFLPKESFVDGEYFCQKSRWNCQSFVSSLDELVDQMRIEHVDMLMPNSISLNKSIAHHYQLAHDIDDLLLAFNVAIKKKYLNYAFAHYFLQQSDMFAYNMGVLPTEYFIDTWTRVLDVLFSIEDQIPDKKDIYQDRILPLLRTQSYQNRVFGFLAERLFSAFVMFDLWRPTPVLRASTRAVMMVVD